MALNNIEKNNNNDISQFLRKLTEVVNNNVQTVSWTEEKYVNSEILLRESSKISSQTTTVPEIFEKGVYI